MFVPFKIKPSLVAMACVFALSACASGGGGSPDVHPAETLNKVTPSPTDKGSHSEIVDGKDQGAATPTQPVDKQDTGKQAGADSGTQGDTPKNNNPQGGQGETVGSATDGKDQSTATPAQSVDKQDTGTQAGSDSGTQGDTPKNNNPQGGQGETVGSATDGKDQSTATPAQSVDKQDTGTQAGSDSGTQGDTPKNNNPQGGQGETVGSATDGKDQGTATPAQPVDKQDTGAQTGSDTGLSVLKPNNPTPIVPTTTEKLDQAIKAIENADKEIADKAKQEEEKEAAVSDMANEPPQDDTIKEMREYANAQIERKKAREAKVSIVRQQIKQLEDAVKLAEQGKAEAQSPAEQVDSESKKAELEKKLGERKAQLASSEQELKVVETAVQQAKKRAEYLEKTSLQSVKPELRQQVWESKQREYQGLGEYENKFKTASLFKAYLVKENQKNKNTAFTEEKVRDMDVYINGEKYEGRIGRKYLVKPLGLQSQTVEIYGQDKDQNYNLEKSWVYEQPYSVVAGYFTQTIQNGEKDEDGADKLDIGLSDVQGLATEKAQLPTAGVFDYEGKAFGGSSAKRDSALEEHQGKFKYRIDFDKRKGSGLIEGLSEYGRIDLKEADIVKGNNLKNVESYYGIDNGEAASERGGLKYYSLGIFGPEANEVAGVVGTSKDQNNLARDVGFGGQRK